jgi:hypothetical protein
MTTIGERLAQARAKLFGGSAADTPTPFELPCDCGHSVAGIRRPRIQIALCSACGKSLFVLPLNVYPATRRKSPPPIDTKASDRATTAPRELATAPARPPAWADNGTDTVQTPHSRGTKRPATPTPKQPPGRSQTRAPLSPDVAAAKDRPANSTGPGLAPAPPPPPLLAPPRTPVAARLRRVFTPFRLLTAGCLALLLLTGGWMVYRQQLDAARRTWRREYDAALTAENDRNRSLLLQSLQRALEAADLLQKRDSDVDIARSLLQQCEALNQLTAVDPVAVLTDNTSPDRPANPEKLTAELRGLYLLFEAAPQPAPDAPPVVLLDLPLVIHGRMLQLSASSGILHQFTQQHPGQSVLFLASVRSCRIPADVTGPLQLELEPDSITLLTSEFLAAEAGLTPETLPELQEILQRQAELIAPSTNNNSADAPDSPADPTKAATP